MMCVISPKAREIVRRKRRSFAQRIHRRKAKAIVSANFLSRKVTKKVKTVVDKFPDTRLCKIVMSAQMPWRRTGILTFDGNRCVKKTN